MVVFTAARKLHNEKKNEKKSLRKNWDTIGIEMYKPNNNYNAYNKA